MVQRHDKFQVTALNLGCYLMRAAIKAKMPDVSSVDISLLIEEPDLTVTVVVEFKSPVRTTDLIKLMQLCVRYFGEQDLPTIESGTHSLVISKIAYVPPKPTITKRFFAYVN